MAKVWSELRAARLREQVADFATAAWVVAWAVVVWQCFQALSGFSGAARSIRDGGQMMIQRGRDLGDALGGLPLVGAQVRQLARDSFGEAGRPMSDFGTELEQFILVVATMISVVLAMVALVPWLSRYVPWRLGRLRTLRAAERAIRTSPNAGDAATARVLAMRAISRLDYATLLQHTPDPLGDWTSGRHDRLVRAELASVGLRPAGVAGERDGSS